jgi:hypothetical protein
LLLDMSTGMHIDRDDRGDANDVVVVDGETKVNPLN